MILLEYFVSLIVGVLRLLVAPFLVGGALPYVPDGI